MRESESELNRFALILGYNRPKEIQDVINDIAPQVDYILVIDNGSEPPLHTVVTKPETPTVFLYDQTQPANLPRLWNIGFEQIDMVAEGPHLIAVLTDDVRIPEGWFRAVGEAIWDTGAAAGCSSPWNGHLTQQILKKHPDADIMNRMYGPAFMVDSRAHLRADENLKWWWNDTDLDWQARLMGGMVVVPSHPVINLYPNASTVGVNAEQAGRDREHFGKKWGWNPW